MIKEAKFILDKPKAETETHIFLKFACKDSPIKYSTQHKIKPLEWDTVLQRAKKDRSINKELDRLHSIVEHHIESQRRMGINNIFKADLKKALDEKNDRIEKKSVTNNFFMEVDKIIEAASVGSLLTNKSKRYSTGTLKNWNKTKNRLQIFDPALQFATITMETYKKFVIHCNDENFTANYTGSLIKDWKAIMAAGQKFKLHNNSVYLQKEFKTITEVSEKVYLTEDEIKAIYELDLTGSKYLENIRDRYVINLYNGLRISDMKTLSIANIQNGMITHINKKTSKKVAIPLHPLVHDIIEKYNGTMPRQYHEAVVNREIKQIAKMAGLTDTVFFSKTVGGINKKFSKEKWELITNHTSRRSMATNLLKHANAIEAMPVLGMTLKTLQLYNKITAEENAESLKGNSFFKKL
jgi:integrase